MGIYQAFSVLIWIFQCSRYCSHFFHLLEYHRLTNLLIPNSINSVCTAILLIYLYDKTFAFSSSKVFTLIRRFFSISGDDIHSYYSYTGPVNISKSDSRSMERGINQYYQYPPVSVVLEQSSRYAYCSIGKDTNKGFRISLYCFSSLH